jgi:hypothetical protein
LVDRHRAGFKAVDECLAVILAGRRRAAPDAGGRR